MDMQYGTGRFAVLDSGHADRRRSLHEEQDQLQDQQSDQSLDQLLDLHCSQILLVKA
jgi:hypothetical protein